MRSLSKNVDDTVSDDRVINNDIIGFTKIQINSSSYFCKITDTLSLFHINFNNNENKFLGLVYGRRNDVALLNKFKGNRC